MIAGPFRASVPLVMRRLLALILTTSALALGGCAGDDGPADAGPSPVDATPDAGLDPCCPLELEPEDSCGCVDLGGPRAADGTCRERCNVDPRDLHLITGGACLAYDEIPANSVCERPDGG